jgi:hypothetical protein
MLPVPPKIPVRNAQPIPTRRPVPPPAFRGDRQTIAMSGNNPKVKKIWFVFASTPSDATFETTPHAPQTKIVSREKASHRGMPRIRGMAARDVIADSSITK